jgi:L-ascorbate metabolism protein UlaG (beta-lactamase superfamily)
VQRTGEGELRGALALSLAFLLGALGAAPGDAADATPGGAADATPGTVEAGSEAAPGLRVRWLGVAGFSIASGGAVLLHDPYFSRPGLLRTLFGRYRPDPEVLEPLLAPDGPAPELAAARWVLIGHSHFDHLGDAPWLAARVGAVLAGSGTTVNLAQGYGLDAAQGRRLEPGDVWSAGPFEIRVIESRHARVLLGRVPMEGRVEAPAEGPVHAFSFPLGDARGYLVSDAASGARIFLLSSAAVHPPALEALRAEPRIDLLLPAIQGRDPDFARRLVENLRPRWVVPHHFDDFFTPLGADGAGAPRDAEDLAAFGDEIRAAARAHGVELEVRTPVLFGSFSWPGPESP